MRDAGGRVVMEPFDVGDSGRMAVFTDLGAALICVWQAKEFKGAQIVNEPGSLNFNNLHTRDVAARSLSTAPCSAGRRWNWTAVSRRGRCPLRRLPRARRP